MVPCSSVYFPFYCIFNACLMLGAQSSRGKDRSKSDWFDLFWFKQSAISSIKSLAQFGKVLLLYCICIVICGCSDQLAVDYIFTFNLSYEENKYITKMNFMNTPPKVSFAFYLCRCLLDSFIICLQQLKNKFSTPPNLHLTSSEQWCWSGGRGILTELSLCYSIV